MFRVFLPLILAFLPFHAASAHEFEADRVEVLDAVADVLDGDTSTLFVQMTIANGAATTKVIGFETRDGDVGDWIEIRRFFGREHVAVLEQKTVRTQTLYMMQRPDGYLVIENVDPRVYTADFGYVLMHVFFEDGTSLDVAAWIDPIYVEIGN